jgi:hypothetical protein
MRFAYADPPYPGQAKRLYGEHDAYAGEVDHRELVERLLAEYPDGWALSTSAAALHEVLPLCPPPEKSKKNKGRYLDGTGTRILVWAKPQTVWRPVSIQYGWEPILVYGGRPRGTERGFLRDYIVANPRNAEDRKSVVANPRNAESFTGAKPPEFCRYLFEALGAESEDELHDLFPGSGAVGKAWDAWTAQGRLAA